MGRGLGWCPTPQDAALEARGLHVLRFLSTAGSRSQLRARQPGPAAGALGTEADAGDPGREFAKLCLCLARQK